MRLLPAALIATSTIAVVAAVFAIWPAVADAPWEDEAVADRTAELRCEGALALRVAVIEAGQRSSGIFDVGLGRGPSANDLVGTGNPGGLQDYDKALADAEDEIRLYC